MNRPVRFQLSRATGWRMPENGVKVDRSTIWGNPFAIGFWEPQSPGRRRADVQVHFIESGLVRVNRLSLFRRPARGGAARQVIHAAFEIVRLATDGRRFAPPLFGSKVEIFNGTRGNALGRCVALHAALLASPEGELLRQRAVEELRGRDLGCWCPIGVKCHGDNWLKVANE